MTVPPFLRTIAAAAALFMLTSAFAADFDPLAASIEDNIAAPAVPQKHSAAVASTMAHLLRTLRNAGYSCEGVRNGEVVMVKVACSDLFAPNSTTLLKSAAAKLNGLVPYIKRSDNFKVVIAVHADDTGDDLYAERITADRANAVDEFFFAANGNEETGIIPYGLGNDEPVAPNSGIRNRALNRRVEIYFVPTQQFIDKSKRRKNN